MCWECGTEEPDDRTMSDIDRQVETLNRIVGFPDGFRGSAEPGFFRLLSDYGGLNLVRVITYTGGVRSVLGGYHPPEVLKAKITGFIAGIHEGVMTLKDYKKIADGYQAKDFISSAEFRENSSSQGES